MSEFKGHHFRGEIVLWAVLWAVRWYCRYAVSYRDLEAMMTERGVAVRAYPRPQVQTLARTLALTGCRVSEALSIRACDVDLDAAEIRIATLKRRREHWRGVPVPENLINELELVHRVRRAQASPRGRTALLWDVTRQAAHRQVSELMRRAGIEGPQACPRGLRHGWGVTAVTAGVPLTTIAAVLGHANVSTTAYTPPRSAPNTANSSPGCGCDADAGKSVTLASHFRYVFVWEFEIRTGGHGDQVREMRNQHPDRRPRSPTSSTTLRSMPARDGHRR